jgi:hypothetical protein
LLTFDVPCAGQASVKVSEPRLELKDNLIHISYDILNSTASDQFIISLFIKDEDGNEIVAKTLQGDVGHVTGGSNKQITWDPAADQVFINSRVYIKVIAKVLEVPGTGSLELTDQEDDVSTDGEMITEIPSEAQGRQEGYSQTGLIIQSTLFPGWGLSRVKKKPHWLKGIAGYGCIAGSIYMNRKALDTYSGIDELVDSEALQNQFTKARQEYWISNGLAYTAVVIWATDLIWTIVGSSDWSKSSWLGGNLSLYLDGYTDPFMNAPTVGIRFDF